MATASGTNPLPRQIQNTQTSAEPSDFDASHIICGFPNAGDIQIKGIINFVNPIDVQLDEIKSLTVPNINVKCLNDEVQINSQSTVLTQQQDFTLTSLNTNITGDDTVVINSNLVTVNGNLSNLNLQDGNQISSDGGASYIQFSSPVLNLVSDNTISLTATDVNITGNVVFSPPLNLPLPNEIIAGDLSSSIKCLDTNIIVPRGEITNLTMQEGALIQSNTAGTTQQFTDSQLLINTPEIQAYSGGSSLQFNDFNLRVVTTEVEMNTASITQFALNHELNLTTTRVAITTDNTIELTANNTINLISTTGGIITDGPINVQNHRIRNLADATANKDALNRETADGRYYLNTTVLNNITAPTASLSLNSQKITNLANATLATDALNRQTADGRYYLNTTTLNSITAPTASLSLNSQKITGLADATLATDGLNRQTGDGRYYLNTTTLNSITAPTGSLALNSQKITGLAAGTNPTDAVNFSQLSAGGVQTRIESTDLTNSVNCNATGQTVMTNGTLTVNSGNDILLNSTQVKFNGNKSTNYVFIYGQSSESGSSTSIGSVGFQIPGIGPVTYPCARLNGTFANWFNFQSYNLLTQPYIVQDTSLTYAFKTMGVIGQLMRIEILFTTYSFSTTIVQGLHIGLYDVDQAVFVPESLFCYTNDATNQYRTLRSSFYMKVVSNTRRYVPFFSQTSVSQVQVQSTMGRCTISFKIYPYVNINVAP